MQAVVGISDHCGWAECITVGVRDNAPLVLDRRRATLIAPGLPGTPYHHEGLELPLADAEKLINRVRQSIVEHTQAALSELRSSHGIGAVVLQESPFERLPDSLAEVLTSWRLTCAADGMMYREALADCAAELGMEVIRYPRKSDEIATAAAEHGAARETVAAVVLALGRELGPPWRKEHQNAAAAALRVVARRTNLQW